MFKYTGDLVILLIAILLDLVSGAQQDSSFVLLDIHSENYQETKICANYQQFFLRSLGNDQAMPLVLPLGWWDNKRDQLDVCASKSSSQRRNIVPLDYVSKDLQPTPYCQRKRNETNYIQMQIDQLESADASAALFLMNKGTPSDFHGKNYLFSRFYNPKVSNTTPTFYMYKQKFEDLNTKIGSNSVTLHFYRPKDPFLDAGVIVLLFLSTGCILIGCLWYAASLRRRLDIGDLKIDSNGQIIENTDELPTSTSNRSTENLEQEEPSEPEKICCCRATGTCLHIFYTVQAFTIVVVILLLSFFYRSVAVEFFNVFIVIGGALCMQKCITPVARLCISDPKLKSLAQFLSINETKRPERCYIPASFYEPIRPIACIFLILSFAFTLTWRFNMDHPYGYLLLDIMNTCICIYSVKASELRSLRLITFFLIAMFVYDIVMVFGTRLITTNGCSVMVQVVTGMDCTKMRKIDYSSDWPVAPIVAGFSRPQKIPLLFYIPLLSNPVGHCFDPLIEGEYQFMMLGLGDVIAPGYLIAFAFYMDVRKLHRQYLYGFTALIGYALGMISTFISLKLMETAQPALIYLVPFTLIPTTLLCLYKGNLREAWKGNFKTV